MGERVHERISIRNEGERAAKLTEELRRYLQQINHMEYLRSIHDLRLTLSDGVRTVDFDRDEEEEPGNTYEPSMEGMVPKLVEHEIWPDDHPLAEMIRNLGAAKQITLEWSAGLWRMQEGDYGRDFWEPRLRKAAPADCVDYRTLEFFFTGDFAKGVRICRSGEGGACEEVSWTDSMPADADARGWFASGFEISIEKVPKDRRAAFDARVLALHNELYDRFDVKVCGMSLGECSAMISGLEGLRVRKGQLRELIDLVQRMADTAADFGVTAEMAGLEFEACPQEGERFAPFAALRLANADGRVSVSCCGYDA